MTGKNKGYVLITDALVALFFGVIIFTTLLALDFSNIKMEFTEFLELHYASEDAFDVMNKKGTLDQVGYLWSISGGNRSSPAWSNMTNITRYHLERLVPPRMGYKMLVDDIEIYNSSWNPNRTLEADGVVETHASRFLVGYGENMTVLGKTARAYLSKIKGKTTSAYAYFGGFVGQGNLSRELFLPSDAVVRSAYIEVNAGSDFDLYINGAFCKTFNVGPSTMNASVKDAAGDISICNNLTTNKGSIPNIFEIRFTNNNISQQYIGGGFIEVTYNTTQMDTDAETGTMRFYLPQIEGIINYYSSFYVPGFVTAMKSNITFENNFTTFFTIGNTTIFMVNGSSTKQSVYNGSLMSILASSAVSEKTVPIRIGTGDISMNVTSELDIAIVNDRSGSMRQSGWTLNTTINPSHIFSDVVVPKLGWSPTYNFNIPAGTQRLTVGINWSRIPGLNGSEGSEFVINLRRPDGTWIFNEYAGKPNSAGNKVDPPDLIGGASEYYSGICTKPQILYVENPPAGAWRVAVYGWNLRPKTSSPPSQNVTIEIYNGSSTELVRNPTIISIEAAKNASKSFVDGMYPEDKGAYIHFGAGSTLAEHLTFDKDALKNKIDGTPISGGTEIQAGINEATTELVNNGRENATWVMVILTDGQNDAGPGPVLVAAQNAKNNNITIFTIGLTGFVNQDMLKAVASEPGYYYYAPDASYLPDIYSHIQNVLTAVYRTQILEVTGNFTTNNTLYGYPESYIEFTYTPHNVSEYGKISITKKSERFNEPVRCVGNISIPGNVTVSSMKVTSYSGDHWTHYLNISNSEIFAEPYELWAAYPGVPYIYLGDPYIVHVDEPWNLISPGEYNLIGIRTGDSQNNDTHCSADDRAIYTVRVSSILGYGDVLPTNEGCLWDIEFSSGSTVVNLSIPSYYAGTRECSYTSSNQSYDGSDAAADAVFRLLRELDIEDDGVVDIDFDSDALQFDTSAAGKVRSLWGPIKMILVIWS